MGQVWIYNCYCCTSSYISPNRPPAEFTHFSGPLDDSFRHHAQRAIVVGGDFNAHSAEWGCLNDDARGIEQAKLLVSHGLILICNHGSTPTYTSVNAASIVNVTFARLGPGHFVNYWAVLTDLGSESDHFYVEYVVTTAKPSTSSQAFHGWVVKKLDVEGLLIGLEKLPYEFPPTALDADGMANSTNELLVSLSNSFMPKRTVFQNRRAAQLWTGDISDLQKLSFDV